MNASFKFQRPISESLRGKIEGYSFDVGVLNDRPHKSPGQGMKSIAGGPARKTGRGYDGKTMAEVSRDARAQLGVNYLIRAFRNRRNREAIAMMQCFWEMVFGTSKRSKSKRLENLIQAVVRNPLARADYGKNKSKTAKIKKSNRKFIDTGQLFNSIRAKVKVNSNV